MKKTAVEWFFDQLFKLRYPTINQIEIMEQVKEMFEQQIIEAYNDGCIDTLKNEMKIGKQYYNKVFKNK
jgi:GTP1/Obg family GTP-binding protein